MIEITNANVTAEDMILEKAAQLRTTLIPFQTESPHLNAYRSQAGSVSGEECALRLSIDPEKLARADFEQARDGFIERNREALTELAKW